jgi:hypothetical protein
VTGKLFGPRKKFVFGTMAKSTSTGSLGRLPVFDERNPRRAKYCASIAWLDGFDSLLCVRTNRFGFARVLFLLRLH